MRATVVLGVLVAGCTKVAPSPERPLPVQVEVAPSATREAEPAASASSVSGPVASAIPAVTPSTSPTPPPSHARRFTDDEAPDDSGHPRARVPLDPSTAYTLTARTIIAMSRTACFGSCPVYSVGIRGDGSVFFYGQQYTKAAGYRSASIGRPAVAALLAFLEEKQLDALHARYYPTRTDSPEARVLLRQGSGWKRVIHNLSNDSEPSLDAIEREIDRVAGAAAWIGTPPRGRHPAALPSADIPASALVKMLGGQLNALEKTCAAGLHGHLTGEITIGSDALGFGILSMASIDGGPAVFDCLGREVRKLVFPLVDIYPQTELTVSLPP